MLDRFFPRKPTTDRIYLDRSPLPKQVKKQLLNQFENLRAVDISNWTCEMHSSDRRDARAEIAIYDQAGTMVYHGRSFDKVNMSFWRADEAG